MGRTGDINESKEFSIKDIEDAVYELSIKGEITFPQYLGQGLYRLEDGTIVGEKILEEIRKGIVEQLDDSRQNRECNENS